MRCPRCFNDRGSCTYTCPQCWSEMTNEERQDMIHDLKGSVMTRKDFEAVSYVLKIEKKRAKFGAQQDLWDHLVLAMAELFLKNNSKFDTGYFIEACGGLFNNEIVPPVPRGAPVVQEVATIPTVSVMEQYIAGDVAQYVVVPPSVRTYRTRRVEAGEWISDIIGEPIAPIPMANDDPPSLPRRRIR